MRPGLVNERGHVFFRCQECGDSNDQSKAHAFCDTKGRIYCYKCGYSEDLPMGAWLDYALHGVPLEEVAESHYISEYGRQAEPMGRPTLLTKFQRGDNVEADLFSMRDGRGNQEGWHIRYPNRRFENEGYHGLGWSESDNGRLLTSSLERPLVLVEGPYDVVRHNFVSAFGQIRYGTWTQLRAHVAWSWPDPDIISTVAGRRRHIEMLLRANDNLCFIRGLVISDRDPDECTWYRKLPLMDAWKMVQEESNDYSRRRAYNRQDRQRGTWDYSTLIAQRPNHV